MGYHELFAPVYLRNQGVVETTFTDDELFGYVSNLKKTVQINYYPIDYVISARLDSCCAAFMHDRILINDDKCV